jgi:hypothetical protein
MQWLMLVWRNKLVRHQQLVLSVSFARTSIISNVAFVPLYCHIVGRVFRQGQTHDVTVTRIILKGPNGESALDDWITERNLNDDVLAAATSNFD